MNADNTGRIRIVFRQQAWFQAAIDPECLPKFPDAEVDREILESANPWYTRCAIGRGPAEFPKKYELVLRYPQGHVRAFESPGRTTAEASSRLKWETPRVGENVAVFMVEVGKVQRVDDSDVTEDGYKQSQLREAKRRLDLVVGAYALWCYQLAWKLIAYRRDVIRLDVEQMQGKCDSSWVGDGHCAAELFLRSEQLNFLTAALGLDVAGKLAQTHMGLPLSLLQLALWEENIRTRFVLEFRVLENLVQRYRREAFGTDNEKPRRQEFVNNLAAVVRERFPEWASYFEKRQGRLISPTLTESFEAYRQARGLSMDMEFFRHAKSLRDKLSHGGSVEDAVIMEVESGLGMALWELVRNECESRGVQFPEMGEFRGDGVV